MNNAVFFMGSPNVSGRNLICYNITILFITKRFHEKRSSENRISVFRRPFAYFRRPFA